MRPVESGLYRLGGVDEKREQDWLTYTVAMLLFNVGGFLCSTRCCAFRGCCRSIQRACRPCPNLTFNTAVSFATNTNWQNYGGESTLSYLTQMVGLTHQNFVSAATGIALAVALIRGFARASAKTVGNFWVDLTRCTLYILLPLCILSPCSSSGRACRRISAPMSTPPRSKAPSRPSPVALPLRRSPSSCSAPMAAASSTPTPRIPSRTRHRCRNLLQIVLYLRHLRGAHQCVRPHGQRSSGRAGRIFAAMCVIFLAGVLLTYWAEAAGNPQFASLGLDPANMEGKEVRFGIAASACGQ